MHLEIVVLTTHCHLIGPLEAGDIIGIRGTKGLNHLGSLYLPQTVDSKVIRVHYQWLPQCRLGLTGQMDADIPDKVGSIEMREPA